MLLNPLEVSFIEGIKFVTVFLGNGRVEAIVDVLKTDFASQLDGSFEVGCPVVHGHVKEKRI